MISWLTTAATPEDLLAQGWEPSLIPRNQVDPTAPGVGDFGREMVFWDDVSSQSYAGDDPAVIAQDWYHRLQTPRGLLPDDPDWGIDLAEYLLSGLSPQWIEAAVRCELAKDSRASSLQVTVNQDYRITIRAEAASGPFRLTLTAANSTLLLEEISRG